MTLFLIVGTIWIVAGLAVAWVFGCIVKQAERRLK